MRRTVFACLICLTMGSSQAATINVGAIGALTKGGLWGSHTDGGFGTTSASVSGNQATTQSITGTMLNSHTYSANASFNWGELTPVLKAESHYAGGDGDDPSISASAYAYQAYQNNSGASQTYTIDLTLHGIVNNGSSSSNYIDALFQVYAGSHIVDNRSDCSSSTDCYQLRPDLGFTYSGYAFADGAALVDRNEVFSYIDITSGEQTLTETVSFTVAAGEEFMIFAGLKALTFGGDADAAHTFTMAFRDTSNLTALGNPNTSPVPVPAAVWLFGSGLVGLMGFKRRKDSSQL